MSKIVLSGLEANWFLAARDVSYVLLFRTAHNDNRGHTSVSDQPLLVVPGDVRGGDTVTLVVDENLDLSALHNTNT